MSSARIFACMGLLVIVVPGALPPQLVLTTTHSAAASDTAASVIDAVNALRTSRGLAAYSISSILMGTAQNQAEYMASTGSISHTGPGGISVTSRLLAAGYPLAGDLSLGGFRSENIVAGPGMSAAEAVQAWTGDAIHLHTMLSTDLQEIGAGVAQAGGMVFYVIDCARPTGGGVPQAYTPGAESAYSAAINEIIVPVSMSTPDQDGDLVHIVQPGQSLWQIAIAYGVKIDSIRTLNRLPQTYMIQPGDKLLIAHVGTATAAPPTVTVTRSPLPPTAVPTPGVASATSGAPTPVQTVQSVPSSLGGTGMAVGAIVLTALIAAGIIAWAGRSRPV